MCVCVCAGIHVCLYVCVCLCVCVMTVVYVDSLLLVLLHDMESRIVLRLCTYTD